MHFRVVALTAMLGVAWAGPAGAIAVSNFNFEAAPQANGGIVIGTPTGWVTSGGTQGFYNPDSGFYSNLTINDPPNSGVIGTMNGPNVAFVFSSAGAFMTNTTGYGVVVGETYTLTVAVGARSTAEAFGAVVSLLDGDSTLTSQTLTVAPALNSFGDVTLTYTAVAGDSGLLRIRLGQSAAGGYADFDNVRLDVVTSASLPEPGAVGLVALGALALVRRRGRNGVPG
jgi:MYXO-CTERM domain-containing protein